MDRLNSRLAQQAFDSATVRALPERAILVGGEVRRGAREPNTAAQAAAVLSLEDSLAELALLANTAGAEVVGTLVQRLNRPHPATYIGPGKVAELGELLTVQQADLAIFDINLSPTQQRNLGERLRRRVVDRTALILDIFAQRAHTREGQLQVELAQLEYLRPRLSQIWEEWSRLGGAGAGTGGARGGRIATRGPGETQLETDRRSIGRRIADLKKKIAAISSQRSLYRSRRKDVGPPIVALVGYTNAGKSTLLHALTNADVLREDRLFATLDPTTRRVKLPSGQPILLTDTVGFIQRLPTNVIAAFRATLEEVDEADILVHVVDGAHPNMREQIATVGHTLNELRISAKPMVTALNKLDLLPADVKPPLADLPNPVLISAALGDGLDDLLQAIQTIIAAEAQIQVRVRIPYRLGRLVQLLHTSGTVEDEQYEAQGTVIVGTIPERLAGTFQPYQL
ncbi:MAG: GTPase HflX [Dehalococcoidia bacterium]|nr:GTPase HflX [Dehalococcoidia bacterium]